MSNGGYCFAGGGTGGHLTPGIAVAAGLRMVQPDLPVWFAGSDRPLERQMVAAAGFDHVVLPAESTAVLRRHPPRFLWNNAQAIWQARQLLQERQPQAVIGLGGYASVPVVLAAWWLKIPIMLLEQNSIPGRATRWLSRLAQVVCLAFAESRQHLPASVPTEQTGNPVRADIAQLAEVDERDLPRPPMLLILGGSQGAAGLNDGVLEWINRDPQTLHTWRIVHQTGPRGVDKARECYTRNELVHTVESFFDDMPSLYRRATLVISRAGATTLAELACAGCPAVLIPFPQAADNHQTRNAALFAQAGGARLVPQGQSAYETADHLDMVVRPLLTNASTRSTMSHAMRQLAQPDATARVIKTLKRMT